MNQALVAIGLTSCAVGLALFPLPILGLASIIVIPMGALLIIVAVVRSVISSGHDDPKPMGILGFLSGIVAVLVSAALGSMAAYTSAHAAIRPDGPGASSISDWLTILAVGLAGGITIRFTVHSIDPSATNRRDQWLVVASALGPMTALLVRGLALVWPVSA